MRHVCAACDKLGVEAILGPDTPGPGTSHGLCRLHELEAYQQDAALTESESAELRSMLPVQVRAYEKAVSHLEGLVMNNGLSFRSALILTRKAFLPIALLALSGCAGLQEFSDAWGSQRRIERDYSKPNREAYLIFGGGR